MTKMISIATREAADAARERLMARTAIRREIRAGARTIQSVLTDPPPELLTLVICKLLKDVPNVGEPKVRRVLSRHAIASMTQLGELSVFERALLTGSFSELRQTATGRPSVHIFPDTQRRAAA